MVDVNALKIKRILIIDLAFIGDVILAGPLTRAVRARWPQAEICMLTTPLTKSVALMLPAIDKVIVYDKKGKHQGLEGMWQVAKKLRKGSFDLAICMNFALRGAFVAWLARIPYRLGYDAQHAKLFLTWAASRVRTGTKHETENHVDILKPLGLGTEDFSLALLPDEETEKSFAAKRAELGLADSGEYFVVCPLGSYEQKNMPLPLAVQLIRELEEQKEVYLIGGKAEAEELLTIAKAGHIGRERVLAGALDLPELTVFLREAAGMVSVDTGPLHIAQAVQCPTVALFGPTNPVVWGPRNANSRVIYLQEACSPCWGRATCTGNPCMEKIKAAQVFDALKQVNVIG